MFVNVFHFSQPCSFRLVHILSPREGSKIMSFFEIYISGDSAFEKSPAMFLGKESEATTALGKGNQ